MEQERIQKFKDLILNEHYCEDCNELCSIGEVFPLEFVAEYIIKIEKENKYLKEYIVTAPNLDEMTAVAYRNIQEGAYIRGRAEEQQKAEQIIYEHYIPKSKMQREMEKLDNMMKETINGKLQKYTPGEIIFLKRFLQELMEE